MSEEFNLKTSLYVILDIAYNIGRLNFWYDKITNVTYNPEQEIYSVTILNANKNRTKTIDLTSVDIVELLTYVD